MPKTETPMRLTHEEQAKIRFANRVVNIYQARRRMDVRNDAENILRDIGDALCGEGLMV